jgi:hypothetical protein
MTALRTLRSRIAGQRAMREVVDAEAAAPPRTVVERVLGVRALSSDARRAFDTALGDVVVAPVLMQLGDRWDVLHDVPVGSGHTIDHLAIGPGGVFAIRAVHCAGADVVVEGDALTIGGAARDDLLELHESTAVARRVLASALDGVPVTPLFVAVDAARIVRRAAPAAAVVLALPQLRRALAHGRPRLGGDVVASISDLADRPHVWPELPDDDTVALHREFAVIRERVTVALRRRTGWAIAVFSVGTATMCGAIAVYVTLVVLG